MFLYSDWTQFCRELGENGIYSNTAMDIDHTSKTPFIIFKHDVETNPKKALKLAEIEHTFNHKGSYYVQAYLLKHKSNIDVLKKIKALGHEVSYHHDVMDGCKGNVHKAKIEFQENIELFEKNGFSIKTVCQHGNPAIERDGYTSNRDFFRTSEISAKFPNITDIMVNYPMYVPAYKYISDTGYGWNIIFDPINNDRVNSEDKNVPVKLTNIVQMIINGDSIIISTHPHRWMPNQFVAIFRIKFYIAVKSVAKRALKMKKIKEFYEKHYDIAKRI